MVHHSSVFQIISSPYRFLRYSIDGDKIRDQDTVTVVSYVAGNAVGRELAWKFFKENWDIFYKRYFLQRPCIQFCL